MSRQRVSKGSLIPKKEFKLATVLSSLPVGCDFDSFLSEFKRVYSLKTQSVQGLV